MATPHVMALVLSALSHNDCVNDPRLQRMFATLSMLPGNMDRLADPFESLLRRCDTIVDELHHLGRNHPEKAMRAAYWASPKADFGDSVALIDAEKISVVRAPMLTHPDKLNDDQFLALCSKLTVPVADQLVLHHGKTFPRLSPQMQVQVFEKSASSSRKKAPHDVEGAMFRYAAEHPSVVFQMTGLRASVLHAALEAADAEALGFAATSDMMERLETTTRFDETVAVSVERVSGILHSRGSRNRRQSPETARAVLSLLEPLLEQFPSCASAVDTWRKTLEAEEEAQAGAGDLHDQWNALSSEGKKQRAEWFMRHPQVTADTWRQAKEHLPNREAAQNVVLALCQTTPEWVATDEDTFKEVLAFAIDLRTGPVFRALLSAPGAATLTQRLVWAAEVVTEPSTMLGHSAAWVWSELLSQDELPQELINLAPWRHVYNRMIALAGADVRALVVETVAGFERGEDSIEVLNLLDELLDSDLTLGQAVESVRAVFD